MKVKIKSNTNLTLAGWFGAAMFIGCPCLSALFYINALRNITSYSSGQISGRIDISIFFGLLTLVGIVFLLIGRETTYVVLSGDDKE